MVKIYRDYADEPEDIFLPLPEELACEFYRLEMEDFREDVVFYKKVLPERGRILEMGCGTGRVACRIAEKNRPVTGMDISMPMLRLAALKKSAHCRFVCMDMTAPGFRRSFDTILIPYNTLNLLMREDRILSCLDGCNAALHPGGTLIVQVFVPPEDFLRQGRATFQFQMFDRPGGGRIIKEILKKPRPESQTLQIEERFRVRPMQKGLANEDYNSIFSIAAFPLDRWLVLFATAGFTPAHLWGSYDLQDYGQAPSSCCLFHLEKNIS